MNTPTLALREFSGRAAWTARCAWERAAWPEFLAAAGIGLWMGLVLLVNQPLRQELRMLGAQAAAVRVNPTAASIAASQGERGPSGFVEAFMAFLPPVELRDQQLQALHGLATESGVELPRVEYGHSPLEHLAGRRLSMQIAVAADYASCRKFLHALLAAMPNLVIDRVTIENTAGQADRLTIRLDASLYYRHARIEAQR